VKVGEESEIVGFRETRKTVGRASRCSRSSWTRARGRQCGTFAARHREGRCGARNGAGEAGSISTHTKFKGENLRAVETRVAVIHPFFNGTVRSFTSGRQM